jgi:hypothetical protein
MKQSPKTKVALFQDAVATLRELQRKHPLVAGTAGRLAEILEEDIKVFHAEVSLQELEAAASVGTRKDQRDPVEMRKTVELLFEERRSVSNERLFLGNRIVQYLVAISTTDLATNDISAALESAPDCNKATDLLPATHLDASKVAEERANCVAKFLEELTILKNRGIVTGELQRLRREYPLFECLQLAVEHPTLTRKLDALPERKRVISLAFDFAAMKLGIAKSTVSTAWKRHKPDKFRHKPRTRVGRRTTSNKKR